MLRLALLTPLLALAPLQAGTALPIHLPGRMQAEACDRGGEYGSLPPPRVRFAGGTAVELAEGQWLSGTAPIHRAGMYTVAFRTAHAIGQDPLFRLTCDGVDITGTLNAPFTGGPDHWVTLARPGVNLQAGRHVFRIEHRGGTPFWIDWFRLEPGTLPMPGPAPDPRRWERVWGDEFDVDGRPDERNWGYQIGGHGWGNQELQYYTDRPENARVERGCLVIEARMEAFQANRYTSARLVTRGKHEFQCGRVEVRAKLPAATGTWPAIWMMGASGRWPDRGELDIMEHVGSNPGWIHASTHTRRNHFKNGNQLTSLCYVPDATAAFHEYEMEWHPDRITFFVDNHPYLTVKNDGGGSAAWPFDQPAFILLNLALGGWGGPVSDAQLPDRLEIDYVRVYRLKAGP